MGHSRLGQLPQTFAWHDVVALIARGGNAAQVAAATIEAACDAMRLLGRDQGVKAVFSMLVHVTTAARADDFAMALGDLGITVAPNPTAFDLLGGMSEAIDRSLMEGKGRTDFGEMAQSSASEALAALVARGSTSLYGTTPIEVKAAVVELSTERGFGGLAQEFFGRLTTWLVAAYVSRELSAHVGPGRRFADVDAHSEFLKKLSVTCDEAAGIVRRFAGEWYGKTRFENASFPKPVIRDFVHGAFKKMNDELLIRGGSHALA